MGAAASFRQTAASHSFSAMSDGGNHLSSILHLAASPLSLVLRTSIVYVAMVIGFRLFGKRELGQITVFDLAMILLIANAVQNAMVGPDLSVPGGLIVTGTLLILNEIVARLRIHDRLFRRLIEGNPSVLISRGHWNDEVIRREGLDRGEVEMAMRENGVLDVHEVRLAVLEANGSISVVPDRGELLEFQQQKPAQRNLFRRNR